MTLRARPIPRGFSLIELMIAMVAGLIVIGAVLAFALASFRANAEYVQSTRLNQELRNSLDLVSRELRRAGYDDAALAMLGSGTISALAGLDLPVDSQIDAGPPATYSCVIYAYDRAGGTAGALDVANGEVRGLRLGEREINGRLVGVLEYAESSGATQPACDGDEPDYSTFPVACSSSTWCPLSDPSTINITAFVLADRRALVGSTAGEQLQTRYLDVEITGEALGSADYTRTVRSSIRVRSDCVQPTLTTVETDPASFGTCTQSP
jgi:prepilin-type N-terminal cleavage/methylation domain-containing protein